MREGEKEMNKKTFRFDPKTGEIFEACDYPGRGEIAAQLFGSQMPYNDLYKRQLPDATWQVRAFTKTEKALPGEVWTLAMGLGR